MKKRTTDLILATVGLITLSPVFIIIAIIAMRYIGTPILFKQVRPGLKGKPFVMYKFRSMRDEVNRDGNVLPDGERMTRFGQVLRSTSLDELPELWNVLKGDMSLVGPRPLLMEYLPLYSKTQARRHEVRPGITGWAQINGRNGIDWVKKFQLDVWYVDNHSFYLDLKIIVLTITKVFKREGISQDNEATMKRFEGKF